MKTKVFAVLTAVMMLAMSMTAFAATENSQSTSTASPDAVVEVPAVGEAPSDVYTPVEAARVAVKSISSGTSVIVPAAVSATQLATINEAAKSLGANAQVLSCADYQVVSGSFAGELTVACAGVMEGDNIAIIHIGKKGLEIVKPDSVKTGVVTFTLSDLSPIAIVKYPAGATVNYTKSPKTGEVIALMVIAMMALAGAAACTKKVRA